MNDIQPEAQKKGFSGLQVLGFVGIAMLITIGVTYWFIRTYIYAADFEPVALSAKEQTALDRKLRHVGLDPKELLPEAQRAPDKFDTQGRLIPERYTEDPTQRNIRLNERELNALVASNADLAKRFAIDLAADLASAKVLIPVDPDMPFLGGKTLRVTTGLELKYRDSQPVVILRGVSVMGVPLPNAWLGSLKNVDLVQYFGGEPGLWQGFSSGIDHIEIDDGELRIQLKE